MSLRGSGGTFGFPEIGDVAGLLETARDTEVLRRAEGLVRVLSDFAAGGDAAGPGGNGTGARIPEWLAEAAGVAVGDVPATAGDGVDPWERVANAAGVDLEGLATRAGTYLGVDVADEPGEFASARRLVPEALARRARVVPIDEDESTIAVAASDPTDLRLEAELERMTGRRVAYRVAPPATVDALMDRVFPPEPSAQPEATTPEPAARPAPVDTSRPMEGGPEVDTPTVDASAGPDQPLRVLIVDDEPEQRLFTRAILEKKGYDVVEAEDGVHALEVFGASGPIGLVVADLNMPRMDGLELIWELRAGPGGSSLPVIVVTGEKDRMLESQLIEEGADDYLRKPIEPRLFLARVESTLRRHAGS